LEDLQVDIFDDAAVLTGMWFFQRAPEPDTGPGSPEEKTDSAQVDVSEPQWGPATFVCVEEDGQWRFVHMTFGEYRPDSGDG
jgi:hypothetical protein